MAHDYSHQKNKVVLSFFETCENAKIQVISVIKRTDNCHCCVMPAHLLLSLIYY